MTYKDKIKWILWWFGLRATLPASVINAVQINENGEELVDIRHDAQLYFSSELQARSAVYLRKTVYEKIKTTSQNMPQIWRQNVGRLFQQKNLLLWPAPKSSTGYYEIKILI